MSIKFSIRNTAGKAVKEGDLIVRYSGTAEPFNRSSERDCKKVGENAKGEPKLIYNTGLDETKVQFFSWYNEDEKKVLIESIKDLKPIISSYYGGDDVIDSSNQFFWKENRDVNLLSLSHENIDTFYDTANPAHALLYLSIASGAFIDMVAPTKEWAETKQLPHYLILDTEDVIDLDDEEDIRRSDAHAALVDLRKTEGKNALFMLAWCLQYDTNAFGAYNHSSSEKDLVNYHIKYIDGKLVTKKKRNTPKSFLEYYNKWKGQQTRPHVYAEAYIKAGEYFSFVNQREKKFCTSDGTILGNTINEAVTNILKPKFNVDFEKLRDQVENKWNE